MYHDNTHIKISATGSALPARVVSNEELSQYMDTSDQWIYSHTGIKERRWAAEEESTSELAYQAAKAALKETDIAVDAIICATATADYPGFPSLASQLSERLNTHGPAFDLSAACTGFIYALSVARSLISSRTAANVLVVGAEKLSAALDLRDRSTAVLFGDGAGAVLLTKSSESNFIDAYLRSEGSGSDALTIDPVTRVITMDGRAVYTFAIRALIETIEVLLARNHLAIEKIDWIVPHQANQRIIAAAAKRYGISAEKFYLNIDRYANTSAASIPLALDEMNKRGLLSRGDRILLAGFGSGLTYGGVLLIWK